MAGLLALAVGAAVVGTNAPAMGAVECTRDPLVLDGGMKLGDGACVTGGRGDRGGALWWKWTGGLDSKEELLNPEDLVNRELDEFGIGGDEGFNDGLLIGDCSCHVVKDAVKLGGCKEAVGGDTCKGCLRWDVLDGVGSGSAGKDIVVVTGGTLLTLDSLLCFEGPGLQCWPCFGSRSKAVPVKAELRKASGCEEGPCGNGGKPVVCDGEMGMGGLLLGILKSVDVMWGLSPHQLSIVA